MTGLMQDYPLVLGRLVERGERMFPHQEIVTALPGGRTRYTYRDWAARTRRIPALLENLGVGPGETVASLAWNSAAHLELYFGVPGSGRILHTLNPRLHEDQLVYSIAKAGDVVIFVDQSLTDLLQSLRRRLPSHVRCCVVLGNSASGQPSQHFLDYDALLGAAEEGELTAADERAGAVLCFTSGTTGDPKGVLYSHRSILLQAQSMLYADTLAISERDTVMPIAPMYHANAWGLPYATVLAGAKCVLPGRDMSGSAIADLIATEGVTVAGAVPTVWTTSLDELSARDTSSVRLLVAGGAAVPPALSDSYREALGIPLTQAWGMTETSAICTLAIPAAHMSAGEEAAARRSAGRPSVGVDIRVVDVDSGDSLAWDGVQTGELQVRGPWIAAGYYEDSRPQSFTPDGWLRTGDLVRVDADGYLWVVDRTKDLIKSGGEWISSVDLENVISGHPKVVDVAVVAVQSRRWSERPLACVVVRANEGLTVEELREFLTGRVTRWWIPDAVEVVTEIPRTSVGKKAKAELRNRFSDYLLP